MMSNIKIVRIEPNVARYVGIIVGTLLIIVGMLLLLEYIIDFIKIFIGLLMISYGTYLIMRQKSVRNFKFFRF